MSDLRLTFGAAVACALVALLVPFELVRLAFALPLALLLPGYAIAAATFVYRPLSRAQLLLASIALSLMALALGSLPLNYLPGGLTDVSWALLLVVVVAVACAVAARRRAAVPAIPPARLALPRVSAFQALTGIGGVVAVVAALVLAFTTLPAKNALGYSELWMLPRADGSGVRVGIASQEQGPHDYRLRVAFGSGDTVVEKRFAIKPGEERTIGIDTPAGARGDPVRVNAVLWREDDPGKIYRRVSGFLPGAEPQQ